MGRWAENRSSWSCDLGVAQVRALLAEELKKRGFRARRAGPDKDVLRYWTPSNLLFSWGEKFEIHVEPLPRGRSVVTVVGAPLLPGNVGAEPWILSRIGEVFEIFLTLGIKTDPPPPEDLRRRSSA